MNLSWDGLQDSETFSSQLEIAVAFNKKHSKNKSHILQPIAQTYVLRGKIYVLRGKKPPKQGALLHKPGGKWGWG